MSTASVLTLSPSPVKTVSLWLQKGSNRLRTPSTPLFAPAARPSSASRQEAEKLRTLARNMMHIDPGSAADMYAAADRHEFGHGV